MRAMIATGDIAVAARSLDGFVIGVTADRRWEEQAELLERRGARVVHGPTIRTIALVADEATNDEHDFLQVKRLRVVCGTEGPREASLTLAIGGIEHKAEATGDGPVDAAFNAVDALFPHQAKLEVYQVHAVTEGTDAQATVSVRLSEDGRIATGQSADTDTVLASVKAYVNALNRLLVRRLKSAPDSDVKSVNYKDLG